MDRLAVDLRMERWLFVVHRNAVSGRIRLRAELERHGVHCAVSLIRAAVSRDGERGGAATSAQDASLCVGTVRNRRLTTGVLLLLSIGVNGGISGSQHELGYLVQPSDAGYLPAALGEGVPT